MTGSGWALVEVVARLLEREEREAVLGDLAEGNEGAWRGLRDVFGLVLRRQAFLWKEPQAWLAGFGVALPSSYLLAHVSVSVTATYERLFHHRFNACWPTGHEGFALLLCHFFLLMAWSWACGYVVGSASRRTVWASAALSLLACAFCLITFRFEPLPRVSSLLFVVPAVLGVWHGFRNARIPLQSAWVLAVTVTVLMISAWSRDALWVLNWILIWPAWYLVGTAWRRGREDRRGSWPLGQATYTSAS